MAAARDEREAGAADEEFGQLLGINAQEGGEDEGGKGGFLTSAFTVFNSTVGTGILTLPYSFRMAGAAMGFSILFVYTVIMGCTAYAVVRVADKTDCKNFQQIVKKVLGSRAGVAMSMAIVVYCYLVCIGCLVIVADVSGPLITHFAGDDGPDDNADKWFENRKIAIIGGALLALPPMLLKDFTSLAFTALLSFIAVVFVVIVIVDKGHSLTHGPVPDQAPMMAPSDGSGDVEWGIVNSYKLLYAVPNVALSLQCHVQSPGIYSELRTSMKYPHVFAKVISLAFTLCLVLYSACAFFGYVTFRDHTPPNIMSGGYNEGSALIVVARFCLIVTAVCAVPINHHPCRAALYDLYIRFTGKDVAVLDEDEEDSDEDGRSGRQGKKSLLSSDSEEGTSSPPGPVKSAVTDMKFYYTEVTCVWFTMTGLAMVVPNLAILNDIIGFTAGVAVMFIFPGLFLIHMDPFKDPLLATHPTAYRGTGYFFVGFGVLTACISAFSFVAAMAGND